MNPIEVRVSSPTELVDPRTADLDVVPTLELVRMLNDEDQQVPGAVAAVLPTLAALVDTAAARVAAGGSVHYFGAGTSGRLGVLDAAELLPTFGIADTVVRAHQAGGEGAMLTSIENAEDDDSGADAADVTGADVVIGLAASGRTPYVRAALATARSVGAVTALVTSNPDAPLAPLADFVLAAETGPEALAGSTRLKAGTAQKLILNTFSTALMVRLGHTYRNLMVDMRPTNGKLRGRAIEIVVQATGAADAECAAALDICGDIKTAVVYLLAGSRCTPAQCRETLAAVGGSVRAALRDLGAD